MTLPPTGTLGAIETMSHWLERILSEFQTDLSPLWVAADPDGLLLDERLLSALSERGFEVLPFNDSVVFRAEYEERYREAWDRGQTGIPVGAGLPANKYDSDGGIDRRQADSYRNLILHCQASDIDSLPWDYLRQARMVALGLANLFPKLNYAVIRQIGNEHLDSLYTASLKHADYVLGERDTKDFVLIHIFHISPHLINRVEDFWRELLRLHYRQTDLPDILANRLAEVLIEKEAFKHLHVSELFTSRSKTFRLLQEAWEGFVQARFALEELPIQPYNTKNAVPFEHDDVRVMVDSLFLDGALHPVVVRCAISGLPDWMSVGIVQDPLAMKKRVEEGAKALQLDLPGENSSFRDWGLFATRYAELVSRWHSLEVGQADSISQTIKALQRQSDDHIQSWVRKHYAVLPSVSIARAPVMLHHVPRFLRMRHAEDAGQKLALVVMDGLALDQWITIREWLSSQAPQFSFEEGTCFAWLPSLTSVSRQALFSGLTPRGFAESIQTTNQEKAMWFKYWQDHGLRAADIYYRKSIKRVDDLVALESDLNNADAKVLGLVVDTVDEIMHGAVLGKRGIAGQIQTWCESGFIQQFFSILLDKGYRLYLTSDHGNVDAVGIGHPNEGVIAEMRGERVRVYRNEALMTESATAVHGTVRIDVTGLPNDFMPLYASGRNAFFQQGQPLVAHGGVSVEELIVPFVEVSYLGGC